MMPRNQHESGWNYAGGGPAFPEHANNFGGGSPALSYSLVSGPTFGSDGKLAVKPSRDQAFSAFFGLPSKAEVPNPYDDYDVENYQLPDGFQGSRPYMKYIILQMLSKADQYPFRELAPWQRNDNSREISWDAWFFHNHMLGRTPEESVSRMLTMHIASGKASMIREGIAFMLEHGFMNTPKGRENYRRNIEQIVNATAVTLAYGSLKTYFEQNYRDPNRKWRRNEPRSLLRMKQMFQDEQDMWAIVQRTEGAWDIITERCDNTMIQRIGKKGNYAVVPPSLEKYAAARPENNYYLYSGIPGGKRDTSLRFNGTLRTSVPYRTSEHEPSDDISVRERTIGGFSHMLPSNFEDIPDLRARDLNTLIYNEDSDDYYMLQYSQVVANLGLFWVKPQGPNSSSPIKWPISDTGKRFFSTLSHNNTWGAYMMQVGVLDRFVSAVLKLNPEQQRKFVDLHFHHDLVKPSSSSSSSSSFTSHEKPTHTKRPHGSGRSGRRNDATPDTNNEMNAFFGTLAGALNALAKPVDFAAILKSTNGADSALNSQKLSVQQRLDALAKPSSTNTEFLKYWRQGLENFKLTSIRVGVPHDMLVTATLSTLDTLERSGVSVTPMTFVLGMSDVFRLYTTAQQMDKLTHNNITLTPLEKYLSESGALDFQKAVKEIALDKPQNELTALVHDRVNRLMRHADDSSPYVVGLEDVHLLVSVSHPRRIALAERSLLFTLASNFDFLIDIPNEYIDAHVDAVKQKDSILINQPDRDVKHIIEQVDKWRVHALQFVVTCSVVFRIVRDALNQLAAIRKQPPAANPTIQAQEQQLIKAVASKLSASIAGRSSDEYKLYLDQIASPPPTQKRTLALFSVLLGEAFHIVKDFVIASTKDPTTSTEPRVQQLLTSMNQARDNTTQREMGSSKPESWFASLLSGSNSNKPANVGAEPDLGLSFFSRYVGGIEEIQHTSSFSSSSAIGSDERVTAKARAAYKAAKDHTRALIADMLAKNPDPVHTAAIKDVFNSHGNSFLDLHIVFSQATDATNHTITEKERDRWWNLACRSMVYIASRVIVQDPETVAHTWSANMCLDYVIHKHNQSSEASKFSEFHTSYAKKNNEDKACREFVEKWHKELCLEYMKELQADATRVHDSVLALSKARFQTHGLSTALAMSFPTPDSSSSSASEAAREAAVSASVGNESSEWVSLTREMVQELLDSWQITSGALVKFGLDNDLPPLIGVLNFRPCKRYSMGSMIYTLGWGESGRTYYGNADFQLSDNVAQKMHYGHFTLYAKTVVYKPEMVVRVDNIVVKDYLGGNGVRLWNVLEQRDIDAFRSNELYKDIFPVAVRPDFRLETYFLDMTGRFNDRLHPNEEAKKATAFPPMDRILSEIWGWRSVFSPLQNEYFANIAAKFNTLCFQEHQKLYNHATRQWDRVIIDKGHFGANVYPGCGEVRRGVAMYFKPVDYTNTRTTVVAPS
jgi:hypothetical protein